MKRRCAHRAKTAAAAVLGFATFVASPEHIFKAPASIFTGGVNMAQAQVKKPTTEGTFKASELLSTISALSGSTAHVLPRPKTASESAVNSLKLWDILKIVSGPKPDEGTSNRVIYDRAVADLGKGNKDDAVGVLSHALNDALETTEKRKPASKTDFGSRASRFEAMLRQLDSGINADEQRIYQGLRPARSSIAALIRVFEGGKVTSEARVEDVPTTSPAIPIVVPPIAPAIPAIVFLSDFIIKLAFYLRLP